MNKIKALIVDDEDHARTALSILIAKNCPELEIIDMCDSADAAIESIKKNSIDILFLDIEMPIKNGFDLIGELTEIDFHIIFTTAYDEFALEAFKVNALAYLLKPIDVDELRTTVDKLLNLEEGLINQNKLLELFKEYKTLSPNEKIAIPTKEGLEFINSSDIIRCESDSNYTFIYLLGPRKILVSKTLKEMERLINNDQFIRVHSSHLVNMNYMKKYL